MIGGQAGDRLDGKDGRLHTFGVLSGKEQRVGRQQIRVRHREILAEGRIADHLLQGPAPHGHGHPPRQEDPENPEQGVKDPVCGMTVDPHTAKYRHTYEGRPYYFCAARCKDKFVADPALYLKPGPDTAPPVADGAIYTCPMHPEIREPVPGSCPICGMALEPETVSADAPPNPELADMTRRMWIGLALALPVVALEMGGHLTNLHRWVGQGTSNWIQLFLAMGIATLGLVLGSTAVVIGAMLVSPLMGPITSWSISSVGIGGNEIGRAHV